MLLSIIFTAVTFCPLGCGGGVKTTTTLLSATPGLSLTPTTASIDVGSSVLLTASGSGVTPVCEWHSSNSSILSIDNPGRVTGVAPGMATVSVTCASGAANAAITVAGPSGPIKITKGGTYSGNWKSDDPATPAVLIATDEPVTITNSVITARGDIIRAFGGTSGGNLTVTNTTGIGLDPGEAGLPRGRFVEAEKMATLSVQNCTMRALDFGIYVAGSTMSKLSIKNNIAQDLDDRLSDGNGGTQLNKRNLGHFIMLNQDLLTNGGEIAWNQLIDTPGLSSIEDIISIYESQGASKDAQLIVHDNYLEGGFATGFTGAYTGVAVQFDGDTNDPAKANGFITMANNVAIHLQHNGFSLAAGHDILLTGNRIVSCGQDGAGNWFNVSSVAIGMMNYYNTQQFYNNTITGSTGGMIIAPGGVPRISDAGALEATAGALHNTQYDNNFDDPCWVNGKVSQAAEAAERSAWQARVSKADQTLGDTH